VHGDTRVVCVYLQVIGWTVWNIRISKITNGIVPKSYRQIGERGKIDTPNIHDRTISWLGRGTSMKNDGAKLILWVQTSLRNKTVYMAIKYSNKMSFKYFKNSNLTFIEPNVQI
jgi:hypothetical protein